MNTVKKSFSILESLNKTEHVSFHLRHILDKRSRNSKGINIQQTVFTKRKIQQGYGESK